MGLDQSDNTVGLEMEALDMEEQPSKDDELSPVGPGSGAIINGFKVAPTSDSMRSSNGFERVPA